MQSPTLPIQISGASAGTAPARQKQGNGGADGQFSAALSREVGQRQKQDIPVAPKPAAKAPQSQQQSQQAGQTQKAPQNTPAQQGQASGTAKADAGKEASADAASADAAAAEAAAAAAANPALDMLALVASLALPANPAATATPVADALQGAAQALAAQQGAAVPGEVRAAALPGTTDGGLRSAGNFNNMMAQAQALPDQPRADAGDAGHPLGQLVQRNAVDAGDSAQAATRPNPLDALQAKAVPDPSQLGALRKPEATLDSAAVPELGPAAPTSAPLQQAALSLARSAEAGADKISARVGTPAWDNQVGQKVVWMIAGKEQSATLTLNPPDMGPMQVVLSVNNDQASVTFSAAQPEVRQALEDAMPKLREMLGESGLSLGNASVNDGAREQAQARAEGGGRGSRTGGSDSAEPEVQSGTTTLPRRSGGGQGLVDTFA